ncbi:YopX family protein [Campylobacter taeniopygiae]|uniref:YopX protein domain-containing protein n=1 Tax=Campylobacter taeniopygiae TaxID=2510188 RepID=A0ABY2TGS0_9BACT|nr:YopX family protein [Campylobacter taeniopygiae]TKX33316.1 hypothetical protein CQA75_08085 [Campylobacter taeniopygiae]
MKLSDFDFRIWSELENGYIEYPALAKLSSVLPAKSYYVNELIPCVKFDQRDDKKELELWTGYYDIDGKKIYENDIVEYQENEALMIKYIKGAFYACQDYKKFMKKYECQDNKDTERFWLEEAYKICNLKIDDNNFIARFEVIGNIHENENLLLG